MKIIGILNITPDSFSDSGKYFDKNIAIKKGFELIKNGVDIIDVGGESTRPGAIRIKEKEEQARVLPVIKALAKSIPVSIDTMNANTAKLAVMSGATIVNDVSGGLADKNMLKTVSKLDVFYVINHWRVHSKYMNNDSKYRIVSKDVAEELSQRMQAAKMLGIKKKNIIIDPGLGFSKNKKQNWELIHGYQKIRDLGMPVMISGSRKRFLSDCGTDNTPESRDMATSILSTWAIEQNAWGVRVHEVKNTIAALKTWKILYKR